MMRVWMIGCWLATVLPMAALLAWVRPVLSVHWRQSGRWPRAGLAGLWLAGSLFLLLRPHDNRFTGLDDMAYGQMSKAFLEGRGFHDSDTVLADVPPALREDFLLHRGPVGRPTRDRVFELSDWRSVETQPFFMPMLPLAAAGQAPVLAPERFVPLVGALGLALVLAAGFCAGGGWGLIAVSALVLGTAWPAWFLRGFYAEGVGAALVAGVVAAASVRPLRGGMAMGAGLALGMAVTYHPTLVVLSVPVGLGLMLERRAGKTAAGLVAGMLGGLAPLWALTRWVCQPYGDWTRWAELREMIFLAPEYEAVAMVLILLAALSGFALWAGFRPPVRAVLCRLDERATPWGWLAVCAVPLLLVALLPGSVGETLRHGAASIWSGIRWPYGFLLLAVVGRICSRDRSVRERFWLAALCWGAVLFFFIKGLETPVGLWSQRRFLPVMLVGIALFVAPLSAALARLPGQRSRWWAVMLILAAAGANLVRWPAAYAVANERGASEWIQSVSDKMGSERRVVFDYYGHSVPYAAGLHHRVLGVSEASRDHWPEVATWLAGLAQTQEVWVATSWAPCGLEEGVRLETAMVKTGEFPVVRTKAFFPAERGQRTVEHHFMRLIPLATEEKAVQIKTLDDSPVGLRGIWDRVKDSGEGRPARWSRQGSGIIGPMPAPGESVRFQMECAFMAITPEWKTQIVRVTPPWGGTPVPVEVGEGWQTVGATLPRPSSDEVRARTGTFGLQVDRPYNPAAQGIRGYGHDLGVQVRQIIIRIEPRASSVSN